MAKDSPDRIPTLDGLRAIAIGLVLLYHGCDTIPRFAAHGRLLAVAGELGVRVFFVLSGYLITTLLVREHARTGRLALWAFFVRRVFRIFPAFYAYLGVMGVLTATGVFHIPAADFLHATTYTMNFITPDPWLLGHTWSLAAEEQFYLVWPATIALLGFKRAPHVALGALAIAPLLRVAAQVVIPWIDDIADHGFPFVCDGLAGGCLLALVGPRLETNARYVALLAARWFWIVPFACVGALFVTLSHVGLLPNPKYYAVAQSLSVVGIALAVHRCVVFPTSAVGRALEHPTMVWVGTLS